METTTTTGRPSRPSNRQIAEELGIAVGAPGSRREVQRRAEEAPCMVAFRAAEREWASSPAVLAERDIEEVERREARAARERRELELQRADEQTRALWAAMPCRWRRDWRTRRAVIDTLAHHLCVRGGLKIESSPSGTRYAWSGGLKIRLSDHRLGYADYGSRKQAHRGPEFVSEWEMGAMPAPADAIDAIIVETREWARPLRDRSERRDAAATLRGLRRAAEDLERRDV